MSGASPSFIEYHRPLTCVRSHLNHTQMQVPSIKGGLTLKEVTVLDVVNLSTRIQDAYLLWNSMSPIDTHGF